MAGNKNLNDAARAKNDEFYTTKSVVEDELKHYKQFFRGKVILCNCDDPYESEFFKYFAERFFSLGLKKLIAVCYNNSLIAGREISLFDTPVENPVEKKAFKLEINDSDGCRGLSAVEQLIKNHKNTLTMLDGDGDFRSPECIELLKQADIVVTNPPFSLFREYVAQLMEYEKNFLIVGNLNAITYREIFPLFMQDKIWLGYNSGHFWFKVPDYYEEKKTDFKIDENGQKWRRMGNIGWFANLDVAKRHENLPLVCRYYDNPEKYPKYDNYDAIEISKTVDIPRDYFGVMGVPITFLDKYNPEQFEIIGHTSSSDTTPAVEALRTDPIHRNRGRINGQDKYDRILIRRRGNS